MSDAVNGQNAAGYRVLARKYRPKTFADLIGQDALVRTLTNAFATGRIAQAYMLTGVRGVGKTTTARLIARAINYPPGPSVDMPELTQQCEAILESRHIDVIEMDAASNTGVDNMREIIDSVRYAPVQARVKVYIIDEVHMLSKSAFNALLKTLEEPPPHVKFIFATTEIRKVPVTILSRCQRFDLKRMDAPVLMELYTKVARMEEVAFDEEAIRLIARAAEGSARDGLSLLDQAIAYGDGAVRLADVTNMLGVVDKTRVIDLFEAVMAGDAAAALAEMSAQFQSGADPQTILADLADFVHFLTRLKVVPQSAAQDAARSAGEVARGQALAAKLSMPHLTRAWQMLLKGMQETATAAQPEQAAEMLLIRLAHAADLPMGDDLARLVREGQSQSGSAAPQPQAAAAPAPREAPAPPRPVATAQPVGGGAQALRKPVPTSPADAAPPPATVALNSFSELLALADGKRDIKLKLDLERYVRPIALADGKFEFSLEEGAPPNLANELSRKLEAWTGRRWMVMVARSGGAQTVARQRSDALSRAEEEARQMPAVQAILKHFPDAQIKVRDPAPLSINDMPQDDTDEESR